MPKFPRPCLKCGIPTPPGGTYCTAHALEVAQAKERKRTQDPARRMKKKILYGNSDYRKARQAIVDSVREFGATCYLCNKPIQPTDPIDIDHLISSVVGSPLAPTHSRCNRSRGNRH